MQSVELRLPFSQDKHQGYRTDVSQRQSTLAVF